MNTLPKNAPHKYAHARPWDKFNGKNVGKKQVSAKEIFRPGHKENASLEAATSSGAYGAFVPGAPARASGLEISRRQFGAFSTAAEPERSNHAAVDALGPVNLAGERRAVRPSKLDEPPPDTLRWNPGAAQENAAGVRRRQVSKLLEQETSLPQPPQRAPESGAAGRESAEVRAARHAKEVVAPEDPFKAGRSLPRARDYEETMRVRREVNNEQMEMAMAARVQAANPIPEMRGGMTKEQRVAALSDPRVQAALDHALNAPNRVAADHNLQRNTTRLSAERRW